MPSPTTESPRPLRGDPNSAPRCGARTRAGCPCRAPAIRGKLRCRMHGGRSTGARTPEGLARLRTPRRPAGKAEADRRLLRGAIFTKRMNVRARAWHYHDLLPPEFQAALCDRTRDGVMSRPLPPVTSELLTWQEERDWHRAEAEALAPWRAAMAEARARRLAMRAAKRSENPKPAPHAPSARSGANVVVLEPPRAPSQPSSLPQHAGGPPKAGAKPGPKETSYAAPHAPSKHPGTNAVSCAAAHAPSRPQSPPRSLRASLLGTTTNTPLIDARVNALARTLTVPHRESPANLAARPPRA